MNRHIVIMAGGVGSRFWPVSTEALPKQFIDILGTGRTMIQMTVDRILPLCPPENIWVVCNAGHSSLVKEQLPQLPDSNILLEPAGRSTAPCIAYACWKIRSVLNARGERDANVVVLSADALVLDNQAFREALVEAMAFAEGSSAVVTLGICPTRPETGYGYIECGESVARNVLKVTRFREKPDLSTAKAYIAAGNFLWNAGIFVWSLSTIERSLRQFAPHICEVMDQIADSFGTPSEEEVLFRLFPTCEKISIDYAVMEKSPELHTIPCEFGWSDLGTWKSLLENSSKDADGNAISDGVKAVSCSNTVVRIDDPDVKEVIVEGLDGYVVAMKGGRLLVCKLEDEQKLKEWL